MLFRKVRKGGYKFTDKQHAIGGIVSLVFAVISVALTIYAIRISYEYKGDGPQQVGVLGSVALLMALTGTISALIGFKESEKFYGLCWAGSVMNGIMWIFLGGMILSGI